MSESHMEGSHMQNSTHQFGPPDLVGLISAMNAEAGFPITVLTDKQGLVLAASSQAGMNAARQSAVVAKIRGAADLVARQLDMGEMDEISLFDEDGQRLVCRPIAMRGEDLILAVMVPNRGQAYRRSTNKAITAIRRRWQARNSKEHAER
jgi:predicted regulator of Ras-like GTPase activity (Roadblock/LC7/MglB family)